MSHPTTQPAQAQTDTWQVRIGDVSHPIEVARVAVPRFTLPADDGVRLTPDKRRQIAIELAIDQADMSPVEGTEFEILTDLDAEPETVRYEANPTARAVVDAWDADRIVRSGSA